MIQLQVLNYILNTKDYSLITLNNLNEKYFSNYTSEFRFIKNHVEAYNQVCDIETFLAAFPNFKDSLFVVNEKPSYLIEELIKDYKQRTLAETFNKIKQKVLSGDTDGAMAEFNASNDLLTKIGVSLSCVDLLKDTSRYDAYLEKVNDIGKYYLSTGFKELDKILGGIDRQEELGVVVARTNRGKSWILLKMATAAVSQGLRVGVYSGEMSENKVGYRVDTLLGHISNGSLTHGNGDVKDAYKKYLDSLNNYKGCLKVLTPQSINGAATVDALGSFIQKEQLDILFIDQLSLLEDGRYGKTPVEKASNISKDLKLLQVKLRLPIISVSQQNRSKNDADEDSIDTTQLAMSDRIAQDATFIIGIAKNKKDDTILELQIVKSRDSVAGGKLQYKVNLNLGEFIYIPNEKDNVTTEEDLQELAATYNEPVMDTEEVF